MSEKIKIFKQTMLFSVIIGLVTHGYFITNFAYSFDSLQMLYISKAGDDFQIAIGRPFNTLYNWVTSTIFATPYLQGLSVIIWLGLSAYFIILVFDITDTIRILVISALFQTNLSVLSLLATYAPDAAPDYFGVFCASVSVWLWNRYLDKPKKRFILFSALLLASALLVYQCNAAVFTVVVVFKLIKILVDSSDNKAVVVLRSGLYAVGIVLISGVIYLAVVKLFLTLCNVELLTGSYLSLSNAWTGSESIIERMMALYKEVKVVLWNSAVATRYQWIIKMINLLVIVVSFVIIVLRIQARKRLFSFDAGMALLLMCALPVAMNYVRLFNPTTHSCHYFGIWIIYLLPIVLSEGIVCNRDVLCKALRSISLALAIVVVLNDIQVSNAAYLKKDIEYDRAMAVMTDVLNRIGMIEGYKEGETKVYFEGCPGDALMPVYITTSLSFLEGMSYIPVVHNNLLYLAYSEFILGRPNIRFVFNNELSDEVKKEIQKMPTYPDYKSVDVVNGVVVVRFK